MFDSQEYIQNKLNLTKQINLYSSLVFFTIGFVFNSISLIIFNRGPFKKLGIGFLFTILTFLEIGSIIDGWVIYLLPPSLNFTIEGLSDFTCRFLTYLRRVILHCTSWSHVIITLDRYLTVKFSQKFINYKTKKNMVITHLVVFTIIALIDIENLFYEMKITNSISNSTKNSNSTIVKITSTCTANYAISFSSNLVSVLLRNFLPFLIMIILNIAMCLMIFESKKKIKNRSQKKEMNFTISVMALNFIFFVFYTPLSISYIMVGYYQYSVVVPNWFLSEINFINNITIVLSFIYNSIPFFINFMFNKIFRAEFFKLLGIKMSKIRDLTINNSKISDTKTQNQDKQQMHIL